jgi:hypothetical protein
MIFGVLAGVVVGFFVGMRAEHAYLNSVTMDSKSMMFAIGMFIFLGLVILASHPPLGKWVHGAGSAPSILAPPKSV